MGLWNKAVEDSVGDGGLVDVLMPFGDGKLGDDDGAGAFVAILQQWQQEKLYGMSDGLKTEVIENEQPGLFKSMYGFFVPGRI